MTRRIHSSIEKLPAALRDALMLMVVDNDWPDDWKGEKKGYPTYDHIVAYLSSKGHTISRSAVGRYGARMRLLARLKQAGLVVRDVMKDLTAEKASQTQKAVAEMITAQTIDFLSSQDGFSGKDIANVAKAIRDCTQVSINADKYIRQQLAEKAEKAGEKVAELGKKKRLDPQTLKIIREQIYGIVA